MNILEKEKPEGVVVQFGGQTPLRLSVPLHEAGVRILGTSPDAIDVAEDRKRFSALLRRARHPAAGERNGHLASRRRRWSPHRIGYPVLVRPSYVLGGRAMAIVYDDAQPRALRA